MAGPRACRARYRLVSVVTRESVEELGIAVGVSVTARVKSTDVPIDLAFGPGPRRAARGG